MTRQIGGSERRVTNGRVWAGFSGFDTAQEAVDYAEENGHHYVDFPEGDFDSITVTVNRTHIIGAGQGETVFDGGSSEPGITVKSNNAVISQLSVKTTGGTVNALEVDAPGVNIENIRVLESTDNGIYTNQSFLRVIGHRVAPGQVASSDIYLDSGSDRCIVDNSLISHGITDLGTNNVVGETT